MDFVFPDKNEKEFVEMAEKLGYKELCFVYEKPTEISMKSKIKLFSGVITKNPKKSKKHLTLVKTLGERKYFEKQVPDVIFGLEESPQKDFMFQRNSGLNHVLAKLAADKKITIVFSLKSLQDPKTRPTILGRIAQNRMLCKKYRIPHYFASFATRPEEMRSKHDLNALLTEINRT